MLEVWRFSDAIPVDKPKSPEVETYWQAYRHARGAAEHAYDVCRMGDTPRAIWRSTTVELKSLDQVDDAFA